MHIEFLIEDSSGKKLLDTLLPKILGKNGSKCSWRLHSYKGVGRIPKGIKTVAAPENRQLLDQLPKLFSGYGKTSGINAVIVVMDVDDKNPDTFLTQLKNLAKFSNMSDKILFGLAIEEMEAWYFGDRRALVKAYPKAKIAILEKYVQDSICGTWEHLADAVHQGGSKSIRKQGWPISGNIKHEWAEKISFHMDVDVNVSPSFCKFRDGLRGLIS